MEPQVATAAGVDPERLADTLHESVGYAGAAHPLLMLANLLSKAEPGKLIAVAAFGQGVDLVLLRTTDRIGGGSPACGVDGWIERRQAETNYLKHLHFAGEVQFETGMRAELDLKASHSALYRDRKAVLGLVGGRCRVTGTVQYPKTSVSVAPNGRMVDTQDDYPLADVPARIVTVTADHLAFTPDPPSVYGMIEFDGELPATGSRMRMMFRVKRVDTRGFTQYFWKAAPDHATREGDRPGRPASGTKWPSSGWAARRSANGGTLTVPP